MNAYLDVVDVQMWIGLMICVRVKKTGQLHYICGQRAKRLARLLGATVQLD